MDGIGTGMDVLHHVCKSCIYIDIVRLHLTLHSNALYSPSELTKTHFAYLTVAYLWRCLLERGVNPGSGSK